MPKAKRRAGKKKVAAKKKAAARRQPAAKSKPAAPLQRPIVIPGAWPFPMGKS